MKPTLSQASLGQSLATASGALAASVAATQASTVQITLTGNKLTTITNTLNADVSGDGINDFNINQAVRGASNLLLVINNERVSAANFTYYSIRRFAVDAQFAANGVGVALISGGVNPYNIKYLNPLSFTDARINAGARTQGYLELNVFNSSQTSHTIALTRLVFNDTSTTLSKIGLSTSAIYSAFVPVTVVPEPSTSFGLLALGAGGLLIRRRRREA